MSDDNETTEQPLPVKREPNPNRVAHAGQGRHCPQEVKDAVLDRIRNGMGVYASMKLSGYHQAEIYDWIREDEEYGKRFKAAKEFLAHHYAQQSVDLLDDGSADEPKDAKRASAHVNLLSARSKARQWLASKWLSQEYGEKIEHRGTITNAVVLLPPLDPLPLAATAKVISSPANETAAPGKEAAADAEIVPD